MRPLPLTPTTPLYHSASQWPLSLSAKLREGRSVCVFTIVSPALARYLAQVKKPVIIRCRNEAALSTAVHSDALGTRRV